MLSVCIRVIFVGREDDRKGRKGTKRCLSKGGKVNFRMLILHHNRHCAGAKAVALTLLSAHVITSLLLPLLSSYLPN